MESGRARPTSRDVAQAAGVSQSTVSLVLAGKWAGRVSPATAAAVEETARRLGYRRNAAARRLRLGQTGAVLLIVPTLSSPFFGAVHAGASRVAAEHGVSVVVYLWPDGAGEVRSPFGVAPEAIDGVLASSVAAAATSELAALPMVLLDSDPAEGVPTVNFDLVGGFRSVVRHLYGLGHRRFGHLAASVDAWTFRTRGEAVSAAVQALGAELAHRPTGISIPAARQAALELLRPADRPTALICDDDLIAAGAYKAARTLGLAIPGDISITGFDDVLLAEALEPELTSVRLPAEEFGAQGMTALLELLDGGAPAPVTLPGQLMIRDSTAQPQPTSP
jgi:DNA-binding LacI/PurR family transcriptional regulator